MTSESQIIRKHDEFIEWWRSQQKALAEDAGQWELKARPFFVAGELCRDRAECSRQEIFSSDPPNQEVLNRRARDLQLFSVAIYLAAVGLESLLKAVILTNSTAIVGAEHSPLYTHRLVDLAKHAEIKLRKDQVGLLERLTHIIEWAGRYPIPRWNSEKARSKADVKGRANEDGTYMVEDMPLMVGDESWPAIIEVVDLLYRRLKKQRREIVVLTDCAFSFVRFFSSLQGHRTPTYHFSARWNKRVHNANKQEGYYRSPPNY